MIWIFYNIIFGTVFALLLPKFLLHMRKRGGYWKDFWQRTAVYSPPTKARLAEGGRFWVHGVSVGEVFVAFRFMDSLRIKHPGIRFVLTTTTSTGYKIALEQVAEQDVVLYFPIDCPLIMRKVLNLIKPSGLAIIETEIWPNLIRLARKRNIPIFMINGRMSDSSYRGYKKLRMFTSRILPLFDLIFVQSQEDGDRFKKLGAPPGKIEVVGTAKYDTSQTSGSDSQKGRAMLNSAGCPPDGLIILAASTWAGEEEILLDIYKDVKLSHPNLFLILAPRHAERRDEVLDLIRSRELKYSTRQDGIANPDLRTEGTEIFLLDSTGELSCFYRHAEIVFVGKSLSRHGGQNPIEPAACGKAVIVGPNMENFRLVLTDLQSQDAAIQVKNASQLKAAIIRLLEDPAERELYGKRALRVVTERRGAVDRTIAMIDHRNMC